MQLNSINMVSHIENKILYINSSGQTELGMAYSFQLIREGKKQSMMFINLDSTQPIISSSLI